MCEQWTGNEAGQVENTGGRGWAHEAGGLMTSALQRAKEERCFLGPPQHRAFQEREKQFFLKGSQMVEGQARGQEGDDASRQKLRGTY